VGINLPRQKRAKLDYDYDYFQGMYELSSSEEELSADEAEYQNSPLTIIFESENTHEELSPMAQLLVEEHPELIPSAKELLDALDLDENKHAQKTMELLKNQHVRQGLVKIFAYGYALFGAVDMVAENVLEDITVANRVALIKRDPLLGACLSGKEDVDIMRGALCILVGYWIDKRLQRWLNKQATNL
ncbi:Unknown protein, partial [Striga hermonthica]